MGLLERLGIRKESKSPEEKAQILVDQIQDKIEDENYSNKKIGIEIAEKAESIIMRNSDADSLAELSEEEAEEGIETLKVLMEEINNRDEVPNEVLDSFVRYIIKKSKEIGIAVVKGADSLPDPTIKVAIEAGVEPEDAVELAEGIDDKNLKKKIQKQAAMDKLQMIYDTCDVTSSSFDYANNINEVLESINFRTKELNEMLYKAIARKMAFNERYLSYSTVYQFEEVMSPLEMLEVDIPTLEKIEFDKLVKDKPKQKEKVYDHEEGLLKNTIIEELAREIASQYKNQPQGTRAIIIPSSDAIKNLSKKEQKIFLKAIKNKCSSQGTELTNEELEEVKDQIQGNFLQVDGILALNELLRSFDRKKQNQLAADLLGILKNVEKFSPEEQITVSNLISQMSGEIANKYAIKLDETRNSEKIKNEDEKEMEK